MRMVLLMVSKVRVKKCKYCGEVIRDDDLGVYPQLDMKRKPKFKKDKMGNFKKDEYGDLIPVTFNAHKKCHKRKEAERIAWAKLYEYVREEYFDKIVPSSMTTRLMDLMNGSSRMSNIINSKAGYKYETIYHCFTEIESDIKAAIANKVFTTDSRKGNYIMTIVEDKIPSYEDYQGVAEEKDKQNEATIDFSKIIEPIKSQTEVVEKENYDILDDL